MEDKRVVKKPDYVFVVKEENLPNIQLYLDNLKSLGLKFENEKGITIDYIFIKLFMPNEALSHFSEIYDIGSDDLIVSPGFYMRPPFNTPFKNPIEEQFPYSPECLKQIRKIQFNYLTDKFFRKLTDAQKIQITFKILENTKYGEKYKEFGITKLINLKYIETAYPLHDGPTTDTGTNSRSLLNRYWSNLSVIHMRQPLDLIYQYFGSEVAFYFAWLEYFNIMLIIPAVLGSLTFILSSLYLLYADPDQVREVCENSEVLCPTCEEMKGCRFKKISKSCSLAQWTFVFDNNITLAYAIIISLWATLFMIFWRRKENELKFRWKCVEDVRETEIRQAHLEKATRRRLNPITGEIESYTPKFQTFYFYTITCAACAIMFTILFVLVLVNMTLKISFMRFCDVSSSSYLRSNSFFLAIALESIFTVTIVKSFKLIYGVVSLKLTEIENPRTQYEFDNSVLYKRYLLAFMNNYMPTLYIAIFKGKFMTLPHEMTFLRKDTCQPCGCSVSLVAVLSFLMTIKTLLGNVFSALKPSVKRICRFCLGLTRDKWDPSLKIPQWEEEYYLEPLRRFSVTEEFSEMVIRYGFITFYSKAFPLAALCALLNNLIELRSDANKFVKTHRRQVPIGKSGIGAWNGILRSLSYLSTAINMYVIAFTSDFVAREVYRYNNGNGSLSGWINSTLAKYATKDYKAYDRIENKAQFCYFRGYYYPPESSHRYTISQTYWMNLTFRLITMFTFEHVIFLCISVFAFCIPYTPELVQKQIDLPRHNEIQKRIIECEAELSKKIKSEFSLSESLHGIKD
ncbi:hypothetical protein ABEB36_012611 [Hypothenemus hampei]|uniref:Anoctamin n=1 Tax=Hypothenemus hampei TaxID=57062 RepID=A0ABD1EDW6_HYPHA